MKDSSLQDQGHDPVNACRLGSRAPRAGIAPFTHPS